MQRAGSGGPLIAGAAFAIAWTPCVGPTLGSILTAAATQDTVSKGGLLLAAYSAGLAVPFLLTAVAFNRATATFRWLRDHYMVVTGISGAILIGMGVLLLTGRADVAQHRGPAAAAEGRPVRPLQPLSATSAPARRPRAGRASAR